MSQTMSQSDPVVIVSAARTPIGALLGELSSLPASDLGAVAVKAVVEQAGLAGEDIDQILMGNVLQAGQGQAPARQAARKAGLPDSVEAVTLNKMCGSGLTSIIMGQAAIQAGQADIIVAGGMENMSKAPFLMLDHRAGVKYGSSGKIYDHMALDGLEDVYEGHPMGWYADDTAKEYQFTREEQDAFALETLARAQKTQERGADDDEIVPITLKSRKGDVVIDSDELPRKARPEKIPQLKPAFSPDGTVTAANASAISDGAAAVILMKRSQAEKRGITPLAEIVSSGGHAHAPARFTTAPVPAIDKALKRAGWTSKDADLYEVNEAFAIVPMAAMQAHDISHDRLNVRGGACAVGHPVGASGARILVTLLSALKEQGADQGLASLCIGGGEGVAMTVKRMS